MATTTSTRRGSLVMTAVFSLGLFAAGLWIFLSALIAARNQIVQLNQHFEAESRAIELVEYFRSMTPDQLLNYLGKNPKTGSTNPSQLYRFCSHVNIVDRQTASIVNPDDLAALGPTHLEATSTLSFSGQANRFYQVQVINLDTLQVNNAYCNQTARLPMPPFLLKQMSSDPMTSHFLPNERFMVTVGVTWVPKKLSGQPGEAKDVKRIVLSTILPGTS